MILLPSFVEQALAPVARYSDAGRESGFPYLLRDSPVLHRGSVSAWLQCCEVPAKGGRPGRGPR